MRWRAEFVMNRSSKGCEQMVEVAAPGLGFPGDKSDKLVTPITEDRGWSALQSSPERLQSFDHFIPGRMFVGRGEVVL